MCIKQYSHPLSSRTPDKSALFSTSEWWLLYSPIVSGQNYHRVVYDSAVIIYLRVEIQYTSHVLPLLVRVAPGLATEEKIDSKWMLTSFQSHRVIRGRTEDDKNCAGQSHNQRDSVHIMALHYVSNEASWRLIPSIPCLIRNKALSCDKRC